MVERRIRQGAGIGLVILGLFLLAIVGVNLAKDLSLWVFGQRTAARIVDRWVEKITSEGGPAQFRYFVRYQFATARGETLTGTSTLAVTEWAGLGMGGPVAAVYQEQATVPQHGVGGLETGDWVPIVYFPQYPSHNRLDETRLVPVLACSYVPLVWMSAASLAGGRHLLGQT